jgi:hypothetical protein
LPPYRDYDFKFLSFHHGDPENGDSMLCALFVNSEKYKTETTFLNFLLSLDENIADVYTSLKSP